MERTGGKWVPLNQYAQKRRVSKSTVYRKIRNGEISKRQSELGPEVFLAGDELETFESLPTAPIDAEQQVLDAELDTDEAYSIADQTLRTMISMHREVLNEKSRMLKEWEEELRKREERIEEMTGALSSKEAILNERNVETRELKRSIRHRDELIKEQERALNEYRRLQEQREEIERMADSTREELTAALNEKDHLIDEKEKIIEGQRRALSQREDVYKEDSKLVKELKKALDDARSIIKEKDELLSHMQNDPIDLDGKIAARDRAISELKAIVRMLESQIDVQAHAKDITGFRDDKGPETGALIQDQLDYIMQSQNLAKFDQDVPSVDVATQIGSNGKQEENR